MRAEIPWTDDRIAILQLMWGEGATGTVIARRLGLSRSAVLGKIFRLQRRAAASTGLSPQPRPKGTRPRGISLLELTNETCRFPHGEPGTRGFFFCGAPGADLEGGRPYCAHHARRAYSSAADSAADDGSSVLSVRTSPSIAPADSLRRYVWRAPVSYPAPRWR